MMNVVTPVSLIMLTALEGVSKEHDGGWIWVILVNRTECCCLVLGETCFNITGLWCLCGRGAAGRVHKTSPETWWVSNDG